jgi:hypothetical protein
VSDLGWPRVYEAGDAVTFATEEDMAYGTCSDAGLYDLCTEFTVKYPGWYDRTGVITVVAPSGAKYACYAYRFTSVYKVPKTTKAMSLTIIRELQR